MVEHLWTVLCTRSVIDKDSNNISLFEVLEQISIVAEIIGEKPGDEATPSIPINAHLVTSWGRKDPFTPEKGHGRIIFESPEQKPLFQTEYDIDLSDYRRRRIRSILSILPVTETGMYKFQIEVLSEENKWVTVSSLPLEIQLEFKEQKE